MIGSSENLKWSILVGGHSAIVVARGDLCSLNEEFQQCPPRKHNSKKNMLAMPEWHHKFSGPTPTTTY
jgi:hypothetical protein